MAFSEETKQAALVRAGRQCECRRSNCSEKHTGRCPTKLVGENWHAHHRTAVASGGTDGLSNCEALCKPCHKSTLTFGAA